VQDGELSETVDTSVFDEIDGVTPDPVDDAALEKEHLAAGASVEEDANLGPVAHIEDAANMTEGDAVSGDKPVTIPQGGLPVLGKEGAVVTSGTKTGRFTTAVSSVKEVEKPVDLVKGRGDAPVEKHPAPAPGETAEIILVPSTITVRKQFLKVTDGKMRMVREEESTETIAVHRFVTIPAQPGYTAQRTVNLGDFNSLKVGVWGTVPCYKEEYDEACQFIQEHTDARMDSISDAIDKSMEGGDAPETTYEKTPVSKDKETAPASETPVAGKGVREISTFKLPIVR
jgi:hypothetical protein